MNRILLIRHGSTPGNMQKRYIGITDEALSTEGMAQIRELSSELMSEQNYQNKQIDRIIVSPLKRAVQSAEILFPERLLITEDSLRETNFGIFEGKNAREISEDPLLQEKYSAWLDSMCQSPVPGGDSIEQFKEATCRAFLGQVSYLEDGESAAFVIHGGSIMAIMERFGFPHHDYYYYHVDNGKFIECLWDGATLEITGGALCS